MNLRHIPRSEYAKRRAYWLEVRKLSQQPVEEGPGGVIVEHSGVQIEEDAKIIE